MKRMADQVMAIFQIWQQNNPKPTTELIYHNDYQLLVAVILSAQSTDKMVNKVTEPLFMRVKTAADLLELDQLVLTKMLAQLGLYQQKAKHIWQMSQALLEHHQGQVPRTRQALEALPGVGRKTANVVLNTAFGQSEIAVDTHIFRVARRLGWSQGKTPFAVEQDLLKLIPKVFLLDAHHWMILHGRYVCQAKRPRCFECLVSHLCPYPTNNQ